MIDWAEDTIDQTGKLHPPRIKGRATNFGAGQDGREWTGDNFLVFFREKHWENRGKFPQKTGRATKNCCWWTGETEISPVLLYGQGCIT